MREVKYTVQPSMLCGDKVIYCGVLKENKRGLHEWTTRGEVTEDVIKCFLNMMKERCLKDMKKDGKGMKYNFGFDGFDFDIIIKKEESTEKEAKKNE